MLFINTELIFFSADLLLVTAGIKKIPTLGLKDSQPGTKRVPRRDSIWDKVWAVEGGIDTKITNNLLNVRRNNVVDMLYQSDG